MLENQTTVNARVSPVERLSLLSKQEMAGLTDASHGGLLELWRRCALAVLNCGIEMDDADEMMAMFKDFEVKVIQEDRGIKLDIANAPSSAFVDGRIIRGIRELLFAVLRDIVFVNTAMPAKLKSDEDITSFVFDILRNAEVLLPRRRPRLVVCWGGHSISRLEYEYTKQVGYFIGLRSMDICTGCGPGAMKGPMKGAAIAHSKQRIFDGRYVGLTEPGIIAAESPNPIVNHLVILPDIEKRLEAFVRTGHGIIVFPGGVGTLEEILYILGILLHPDNAGLPFPLILTGPKGSEEYFKQIDQFIRATLGDEAAGLYEIIIDDADQVAHKMSKGVGGVTKYRIKNSDAFYFNWMIKIRSEFQRPFDPTHDNMANLEIHRDQPAHLLAANLRRAFSGVVAGNVKEDGMRRIKEHGLFEINGDAKIMALLDEMLQSFVRHNRMKLPGSKLYEPCYRIVR